MRSLLALSLSTFLTTRATAADLSLSIEIPRLNIAEYHRPYAAVWIEDGDQRVVSTLTVWYDVTLKNNEGTKWLKDLRQWWRKAGREMTMPVDGLSGATRPAGAHTLVFSNAQRPLSTLRAGSYTLVVEAAREVGGRELLRLPFDWPATGATSSKGQGEHELGAVTLTVRP